MKRRILASLCALILLLAAAGTAEACEHEQKHWVAQPMGEGYYTNYHLTQQRFTVAFALICTRCGVLNGYSYVYLYYPIDIIPQGEEISEQAWQLEENVPQQSECCCECCNGQA